MTEDIRRRMTNDELRRALADMRSIAQAEEDFTQTTVRFVDVSAEDVEALRTAYFWLAALWDTFRVFSDDPDFFGEFGSPEMRRSLPLHRLYANRGALAGGRHADITEPR